MPPPGSIAPAKPALVQPELQLVILRAPPTVGCARATPSGGWGVARATPERATAYRRAVLGARGAPALADPGEARDPVRVRAERHEHHQPGQRRRQQLARGDEEHQHRVEAVARA